ncbi:MAG TPA: YCF48-related protein [Candidatus Krumholzibacteria bacterium]|nr:YCF48-related protein [Candidatus Krumholzibacteria bacterium]
MRLQSLFLLLVVLAAGPARSEWTWRYPQPQGHTLYDIVFLTNTTAIAVGEAGTVLVTTDAGQSWVVSFQVAGVETHLRRIDRLDASSAVAVGDDGVVLRTTDGGDTWTPIASGTSVDLLDVSFGDAMNGIAVAGVTVLRTGNGGLAWQSTSVPSFLRAVDMITATDAIAVGDWTDVMMTTNGGADWTPKPEPLLPPYNAPLTSVDFIDALNGVVGAALGDDGWVSFNSAWHVTSDGGDTWAPLYPFGGAVEEYTPNEILYPAVGQIFAAYRMTCCRLSSYPFSDWGEFVAGGAPFAHRNITHSANGLARNDDGLVLVVGDDGLILRRNPDGTFVRTGGVLHREYLAGGWSASSFADPSTGIVMASDDYMYPASGSPETHFARTTDGGLTWASTTLANVQSKDLAHLSADEVYTIGYDVGGRGIAARSVNGGASWLTVWTSPTIFPGAIASGSPTHAVAVCSGGWALVIDNGTVTPVAAGVASTDVAFATPSVVVAAGGNTVRRSLDGGLNWTALPNPIQPIRALDFATPSTAFAVSTTGILRSDDQAQSWQVVPSGAHAGLRAIDVSGSGHGVAVGDDAVALITSDGGDTWIPFPPPTNGDFNRVTVFSDGRAFASGPPQTLFEFLQQTVPTLISRFDVEARPFGADLRWEVRDDADLASFSIQRLLDARAETIAAGLSRGARSYRDDGVLPGRTYQYQLIAVDRDGAMTVSAPISATIPSAALELLQNHPNPFNPSTRISFVVPAKERIRLDVYDATGRRVATLVDEVKDVGVHTVEWNGSGSASGVYFARLESGKDSVSRKLVLLK